MYIKKRINILYQSRDDIIIAQQAIRENFGANARAFLAGRFRWSSVEEGLNRHGNLCSVRGWSRTRRRLLNRLHRHGLTATVVSLRTGETPHGKLVCIDGNDNLDVGTKGWCYVLDGQYVNPDGSPIRVWIDPLAEDPVERVVFLTRGLVRVIPVDSVAGSWSSVYGATDQPVAGRSSAEHARRSLDA